MLIPLMVIVIILFSAVANTVMSNYVNQQRFLTAQGAVNQLASAIQQINYSLSQPEIMPSTVTKVNPLPETIMSSPYKVTGTLETSRNVEANKILTINLFLLGANMMVNKTIALTPNTLWVESELSSLSSEALIKAQKFANGTISLGFN